MKTSIVMAWPPRKSTVKPPSRFKASGKDELGRIVTVLRGSIIAAMDDAFCNGRFGELLGVHHPDPLVRQRALELFQEMMCHLFPEEFAEPGDDPKPGVIPDAGPRRVGVDRLERWAELTGVNEAAPA